MRTFKLFISNMMTSFGFKPQLEDYLGLILTKIRLKFRWPGNLARANSFNVESLKGQAVTKQLHDTVDKIKENIGTRMFDRCLKGQLPEMDELILPAERIQVSKNVLSFDSYRAKILLYIALTLYYFLYASTCHKRQAEQGWHLALPHWRRHDQSVLIFTLGILVYPIVFNIRSSVLYSFLLFEVYPTDQFQQNKCVASTLCTRSE